MSCSSLGPNTRLAGLLPSELLKALPSLSSIHPVTSQVPELMPGLAGDLKHPRAAGLGTEVSLAG